MPTPDPYVIRTYDDDYGKHALVYVDDLAYPLGGHVDVLDLLHAHGDYSLRLSRKLDSYTTRHATPSPR